MQVVQCTRSPSNLRAHISNVRDPINLRGSQKSEGPQQSGGLRRFMGPTAEALHNGSPKTLLRHCTDPLYIMPISVILGGVFQRKRKRWTVEFATYFSEIFFPWFLGVPNLVFGVTLACLRVSGPRVRLHPPRGAGSMSSRLNQRGLVCCDASCLWMR